MYLKTVSYTFSVNNLTKCVSKVYLFVSSDNFERQIVDIDEENDEITFTTRSTYTFNKRKSLNLSRREKVTILNPAYIGTILTASKTNFNVNNYISLKSIQPLIINQATKTNNTHINNTPVNIFSYLYSLMVNWFIILL